MSGTFSNAAPDILIGKIIKNISRGDKVETIINITERHGERNTELHQRLRILRKPGQNISNGDKAVIIISRRPKKVACHVSLYRAGRCITYFDAEVVEN